MTTRPLRLGRIFSYTVIGALFWVINFSTKAQENNVAATGFTLEFLKENTQGSVNQVASNVVKAVNNSGRTVVFNLELAGPAGWNSLIDPQKVYNVRNGDSLFIPTRIVPPKDALGNVNYFVNASAYTTAGVQLASAPWSMELKRVARWFADIVKKQVFFPSDGDSTTFELNLKNEGNSAETVTVLLAPDSKVTVSDRFGNPFPENTFSARLPVDADTTITILASLSDGKEKQGFFDNKPFVQKSTIEDLYKVVVGVKDNYGDRSWSGRVDIRKLKDSKQFDSEEGTSTIPLNVEFNSYNILSQFTNFSLDLNGDADLGRDRNLRYYFQTIISTSAFTGTQFQGSYRFAQYTTPKLQIAAGDVGQNMEVLINGTGLRGFYTLGKFRVGAVAVTRQQNANLQNNLTSYGTQVEYSHGNGLQLKFQGVYRKDEFNEINGTLGTLRADYRFPGNHIVRFSAGFSNESHVTANPFNTTGFGFNARYSGTVKGITVSSQFRYNSVNFLSQYRGVTSVNANFRYPLGGDRNVALRINMNTRNPEIYSKGFLFPILKYKRNTFEARYGWKTEAGSIVVYPKLFDDEVLGLRTLTYGAGITFSTNNKSDLRYFTRFFTGAVKAPEYDVKAYLVTRWENSLRYKNLNITARYYYGPFNVLDNLRVLEDGITPQSIFLSGYATLNFRKAKISVRPLVNLGYESLLARWRMNFTPVATYYSNKGFEFNLSVEMTSLNQGESPLNLGFGDSAFNTFSQTNFFLKMGVKKRFNIPKPGNKNFDLEVVVFKDMNGNNVRDKGEEFVSNVLIRVNGETLMTNSEGSTFFKNLVTEKYNVSTRLLTDENGWFKGGDVSVVLDKDKTVFIPLKRGAQIGGKITLQRAQFSAVGEGGMDLSRIRVTVQDFSGNSYESLTDRNGEFRLFVPFGKYTIKVNQNAVDQQFEFAQPSYTMDINSSEMKYDVTFYLIEKRRRLNINRNLKKRDN